MSYEAGRPERIWKLTYDEKMGADQVAQLLGVTRNYVYVAITRQRRRLGIPPLGMPRPIAMPKKAKDGSSRGRPPGGGWFDEPPRATRARIEADVAAGKRCAKCWLLLPCDHGAA